MSSLLGAIQTWFGEQAPLGASDGKLWLKVAPQESPLPYLTYFMVSDVPETWTTDYPLKRSKVQVNAHAVTAAEAQALGESFRSIFRGAPLIVGSGTVCHVLPNGSMIDVGEGLGPDGQDCWIASELFDIVWTP